MVFETILNCRETLNENNVAKACILTVFETIQNHRIIFENNVSKACILPVFKLFGTVGKRWEHENKDTARAIWHILIRYFDLHRKQWC